jgi:hypothetical protein
MWNIFRFLKTTRCAKNSKKKRPRHRTGAPRVVLSFPFAKSFRCSSGSNNECKGEGERHGLRQVSLREDNNRGAIRERTKRSGFGEFLKR